jgi:DNA polymerase III subunit delta
VGTTTYEALLSELAKRPPGGAFFFFGDEEYLRERAAECVVEAHLDPATRDFNLDQLRGEEVTAEALASVLQTPPMLAEWRVVVVRGAQGLSQKARESLEAVVASPPPGLTMVITAAIPSGSKAKFYTVLQNSARSVEFAALDAIDAPGRLMEHAKLEHGRDLQPEAARALVAALGTEMRLLASELEKLTAYVGERAEIGLDDVRAVTGAIPRFDRWAWFDLIGERSFADALQQLPTLISTGESGVGLIIGMTTQLLRIGLVCAGGTGALERELKPHQRWLARRVVPQAKRWSLAEVDAALAELLRTDRLLKSASLTDRQAMEELLLRLHALGALRENAA